MFKSTFCNSGLLLTFLFAIGGCQGTESDFAIKIELTNNKHAVLLYDELSSLNTTSFKSEFDFHNTSSETMELQLKITSCGCLSLHHEGQSLHEGNSFLVLPGKTKSVIMEMQYPSYPGKNENKAYFTTKSQRLDFVTEISMSCPVLEDISVAPKIVPLSFDRNEVSREFSIYLTRNSRDKSSLRGKPLLHNAPKFLSLKKNSVQFYEKEIEKELWQKQWCLDFVVKLPVESEFPKTPQFVSLVFEDTPVPSSIDFSVILSKNYGISFPRNISFPDTRLSETRTRSFSIQSAKNQSFTIKSVLCDNPCFSIVAPKQSQELKQHWFEVKFSPTTIGENKGVIIIATSDVDFQKIEIDLDGVAFSE